MKRKKLTSNQIKFIINMLGLVVFIYSYLYIYNGYVEKKDETYKEISRIEKEIETTKKKITEEDTVRQNTEEVNTQVQAIIDSYPVNITKIDNFMFLEEMEKDLNMEFTSIDPTDSTMFCDTGIPMRNADGTEVEQPKKADTDKNVVTPTMEASQPTEKTDGSGKQSDALSETESDINGDTDASKAADQADSSPAEITTMTGLESTITMNFETDYPGFKKLVDYIKDYPVQTTIDSISVSRDNTTNKLTGSLVIKRYALAGTGKVYEEPKIDDISIGTDNIFGTDTGVNKAPADSETADTTGDQEVTDGDQDMTTDDQETTSDVTP